MKYLKTLGLAAVASLALMAVVVQSASATALYSGGTKLAAGTEINATLAAGTSATFTDTEGHTLGTCTSGSLTSKTSNSGGSIETVKVPATLGWGQCTVVMTTTEGGELEVHNVAGTTNGTITAKGFKISLNTVLFGNCVFTAGTTPIDIGILTGSATGNAVIDINGILIKSSGICSSTTKWASSYTVTSPPHLVVEAS
jgi:hypothetical protein